MSTLTTEQEMLRDSVREFATTRLAPSVMERDAKHTFSRELTNEMLAMGLGGIYFPEEYGGSASDYLSYVLAVEEISRVDPGLGITLSASVSLCANPINDFGTDEQKKKFLTPLATGEKLGAFGLTEPDAGTDASAQKTHAVLKGDHYVLNGSKIFITNAGEAEIYIVFAMTDPEAGNHGITAFILEKGMEGFSFGSLENKLGIHTSQTMELIFQDVKVPVENRLGEEGKGFRVAMSTLDGGRIGVAAQAVGIAQGAFEEALTYSKQRVQFGKPISRNQAISFPLADMATKIQAARLLTYDAALAKQNKERFTTQAAMAKCFASDAAMEVTTNAIQIFGGYGYSEDYPVARYFRDAKITQIYEGSNEAQRMVIFGGLLR